MAMYTDSVEVYPWIACTELLDSVFLILETIVTKVSVAIVVIPLGPVRMTSSVAHCNYDESELGKSVGSGESSAPADVVGLYLRAWINVVADRVDLCGIEVKWLIDSAIQVGNAIGGLYLEALREFVTGSEKSASPRSHTFFPVASKRAEAGL